MSKPKPVSEEDCLHCCICAAIEKFTETHELCFGDAMDALERVVAVVIADATPTVKGRAKAAAVFMSNVIAELSSLEKQPTETLQ